METLITKHPVQKTIQPVLKQIRMPRIVLAQPSKDRHHPASVRDVQHLLKLIGEEFSYGLQSIRLAKVPGHCDEQLLFGRFIVPGTVLLFEQPHPPWRIRGQLRTEDLIALATAGASIESEQSGLFTTISWEPKDLKRFMLFDVLMHEIAHHVIQQYKGKRGVQVARTRDHELFARRFAIASRQKWEQFV